MREFAEQEVVIPSGPFEGRRFNCRRQPFNGLWFDAVDSGQWQTYVATGPSQSSKTLTCYIIPTLYHLFEIGETVVAGVPNMEIAGDKWREDLLPAIERSRFRDQLPTTGKGSKGAMVEAVKFRNGATLKFMSGGGDDKRRAAFTARVLVITETDSLDESSDLSVEADKIKQMQARQRAYGARARTYLECTVSVASGRTWRELKAGTDSRLALPCPHCKALVTPEREHLRGWRDAESRVEARAKAHFCCPACGAAWSEDDRRGANERAILLHRGQTASIRRGKPRIEGDPPETDTLGFRWSAVNNAFITAGDIGVDEWNAAREDNADNAEREMCQFVWAVPYDPPDVDVTPLDAQALTRRVSRFPRGILPDDTEHLVCHVDMGKRYAHYLVMAFRGNGRIHVPDYGRFDVPSDDIGTEKAFLVALRDFRDHCEAGWALAAGGTRVPDQVWIDAGWQGGVAGVYPVYQFCVESGTPPFHTHDRYRPTLGRGEGQRNTRRYTKPRATSATVRHVGENYHFAWLKREGVLIVEVDADYWKGQVHDRLATPVDAVGSITWFNAPGSEHITIAKHMTSERMVEEFIPGKGTVVRWHRDRRANHWFDCAYNALAAGHFCGYRLTEPDAAPPAAPPPAAEPIGPSLTTPDGRPFMVLERK